MTAYSNLGFHPSAFTIHPSPTHPSDPALRRVYKPLPGTIIVLGTLSGQGSTIDSAEKAAPSVGGYRNTTKSLGVSAVDAHAGRVISGFSAESNLETRPQFPACDGASVALQNRRPQSRRCSQSMLAVIEGEEFGLSQDQSGGHVKYVEGAGA